MSFAASVGTRPGARGGRARRSSPLLAALGGPVPVEEREDSGFIYYARFFRSGGAGFPPLRGLVHQFYNSVSVLTLPSDDRTWSVTLVAASRDRELRVLHEPDRWTAVARCFPSSVAWLDAEPVTGVVAMAGIEDRIRHYVVDGRPVVTGVLPVGDAWACTTPSLGRGVTMALGHAVLLRDALRAGDGESPGQRSLRWAEVTGDVLEPWYRSTIAGDGLRLAEIENDRAGVAYTPGDTRFGPTKALQTAAHRDPEVLRGLLDVGSMQALPLQVLSRPGMAARVRAATGANVPQYPVAGPDRETLRAAAGDRRTHLAAREVTSQRAGVLRRGTTGCDDDGCPQVPLIARAGPARPCRACSYGSRACSDHVAAGTARRRVRGR